MDADAVETATAVAVRKKNKRFFHVSAAQAMDKPGKNVEDAVNIIINHCFSSQHV